MSLCENMGASRLRKLSVNELWSDENVSAALQDLRVYGWDKIDLIPNRSSGNDITNLVRDTTNKVTVYGDLSVMGAFSAGGSDGATIGDVNLATLTYNKDADTAELSNGAVRSMANHLLLKGQTTAHEVIVDHSRLVAHKAAKTSANSEPDAFSVRGDNGNDNQEVLMGMVYATGHTSGGQTGTTAWRGVMDSEANDMEMVSDSQLRLSADGSATGVVRLAAGSAVEICPSVGSNRGQDPNSKLSIAYSTTTYNTNPDECTKISAVSLGGAANTGEHIWITGDTNVANSSVTVEEVKFVNSSLSTTNAVLALDAATSVNVTSDLILTNTAGTAGSITSSAGALNLTSASGDVNVASVKVNGSAVSTANAVLSLDAATSVDVTSDLILTNTAGTAGSVTTSTGALNLTSASGDVNVASVKVNGSAVSTANAILSIDAATSVNVTSDLILTNSANTAGSVTSSTGTLNLTAASGVVNVDNVNVTGSAVSTANAILSIDAATSVNVTSDLILTNTAGTAGSVTSSTGALNLTSASGDVNVASVKVNGSAVSTANAVLSLDAATSVNVTSDLILTNTANNAGSVTTSTGALNLTSSSGDVNVASVKVNGSAVSTANAVLSLDAATSVNVTSDLILTNSANTAGSVTSSVGPLNLTSTSGAVNVANVSVTNASISTAQDVLSLTAPISVDVNSDLVVTNTAGNGGKVTTSVGALELTSATGEITITGNLNITGTTNSINQTTTNIAVTDKVVALSKPADVNVASWPFDAGTPAVDTTSAVSMSLSGTAAFSAEKLSIPAASAYATATSALFPAGTAGFQVCANSTFLTSLPAANSFILAYGNIAGVFIRVSYDKVNDWLVITDGTYSAHSPAGLLVGNTATNICLRRDPLTSTVSLMTDMVARTLTESAAGHLAALAALSFAANPILYLGHFGADASSAAMRFDDVRVVSVTAPTNSSSSGAGILVEGDGKVSSTDVERSLKWYANTTQDRGDYLGSYWHVKGGQLMLSRTIDNSLRKAPGTSVLLSSLPSSTTEIAKWEFGSGLVSEVGSLTLVAAGTTPASVAGGVLKTNNVAQADGRASITNAALLSGSTNITVVAYVAPQSALNVAGANGLELLAYGDNSTAGQFLRVFTSSAGKLSVTNGTNTDETTSVVVGSSAFTLGLQLAAGVPKIFVNGVERALATSTVTGVTVAVKRLSLGADALQTVMKDVWYDNVRVCNTLISGNAQLYRYSDEYDSAPLTVTYGFRIADDESLQIVKAQGSDSTSLIMGLNPMPVNDAGLNSMGGINSGTVDVVTEMLNKP